MSHFCESSGQDAGPKSLLSMVYKSMVDLNSIHRAVNVACLAMHQGGVTTRFKTSRHIGSTSHEMWSLRRVSPIEHWQMWGRKGSRFRCLILSTLHPALYHLPMIQPSPMIPTTPSPTPPSMMVPDKMLTNRVNPLSPLSHVNHLETPNNQRWGLSRWNTTNGKSKARRRVMNGLPTERSRKRCRSPALIGQITIWTTKTW